MSKLVNWIVENLGCIAFAAFVFLGTLAIIWQAHSLKDRASAIIYQENVVFMKQGLFFAVPQSVFSIRY